MRRIVRPLVALALVTILGMTAAADDAFRAETEAWRAERETRLRAEDGWLTLAGLHWLDDGSSSIGSGSGNDIRLPAGAPVLVGRLDRAGEDVQFHPAPDVVVTREGEAFAGGPIRSDANGPADVLAVGPIRLLLIRRGDRLALRVKDNDSPARREFTGVDWFPIDPSWRIEARFEPAALPTRIEIESIVGTTDSLASPGWVVFEREGREHRLQAVEEGDDLWFVFRDASAGKTTPENGRQLTARRPGPDGVVVLDFNRATNLPCAYTPHATCPLPPRQNRLALAIPAGERAPARRPASP